MLQIESNMIQRPQDTDLMEDDQRLKKDSIDIVLWTLSRALNKKLIPGNEEMKDDDDEERMVTETSELTTAGYSMSSLLGAVTCDQTNLERVIESQIGLPVMPFPNMDRSGRAVCTLYQRNLCPHGNKCHLRHLKGEKTVVCKHWLRGLCKKGDDCEFLHEYDLSKMPECFFFSKYNACSNKECPFRHIDPESKIKDCPWYDRGFCRHGPYCKFRHRRRIMCEAFMVGFCPEGSDCPHFHPPNTLPPPEQSMLALNNRFAATLLCHNCHERGHKASSCPHLPNKKIINVVKTTPTYEPRKQLSDVVCFKCGTKGHYANRCTMNSMSFLRGQEIVTDA